MEIEMVIADGDGWRSGLMEMREAERVCEIEREREARPSFYILFFGKCHSRVFLVRIYRWWEVYLSKLRRVISVICGMVFRYFILVR